MTTATDIPATEAVSAEAEGAVLGACLLATPSYDPVADAAQAIEEGDWHEPAHARVWSAVVRLHGAGRPTGVPAVEAELRRAGELEKAGGFVKLSQLVSQACSSVEVGHYAGLVHGYAVLRRYKATLRRGLQGADVADPHAVGDTIAVHQAEVEHLAAGAEGGDGVFVRLGDDIADHLQNRLTTDVTPDAVTGLRDLDELIKLQAGTMTVVAARPAMGKSAFALGIAVANASAGHPSLVHSLEMGRVEINNRVLAARSRVEFSHLRDGAKGLTEGDWERLNRHAPDLRELPLWIDYTARLSPARIRSRVKTLTRQAGRPPLVVVDYLGLMQTDQRSNRQSLYERVTEISRELKILADETGIVLIALAQLNRASEQRADKRPTASDLRDSGALEQDADNIILLHREDYYEPECLAAGETELIVAKHRAGATKTVKVAHQFHYSRLRDMAPEVNPA